MRIEPSLAISRHRTGDVGHIDGPIAGVEIEISIEAGHIQRAVRGTRLEIRFSGSVDNDVRLVVRHADVNPEVLLFLQFEVHVVG